MRWRSSILAAAAMLVLASTAAMAQTGTTVGFYSQVPTVADAAALAATACSSTVNTNQRRLQLDTLVEYHCHGVTADTWVAVASAAAIDVSGFADGSVTFVTSGVLDEDNANLFWDDANDRLGIRTISPTEVLTVDGNIRANSYIDLYNGSTDFTRIQRESGAAGLLKIFRQGSTTTEAVSVGGGNAELQIGPGQEGRIHVSGSEFRIDGAAGVSINFGAGDLVINNSGDVNIGGGDLTVDCGAGDCTLRYIQGALGVVDQIDFGDFVIDAAGNVGIGTAAPNVALTNHDTASLDQDNIAAVGSGFVWSVNENIVGYAATIENRDANADRHNGLLVKTARTDTATFIAKFESGGINRVAMGSDGTLDVTGDLTVTGFISGGTQATTLPAAATTFAATTNMAILTGDGGSNTLATITGAPPGTTLKILCTDALVTITDDNTHAADSVDLSAAFTCADDTTLTLSNYAGVSWYEDSRSIN